MEIQEYLKYRVDLLNESKDEDGFINESSFINNVIPSMLDAKLIDTEDFTETYYSTEIDGAQLKINGYIINDSGERLQLFILNDDSISLENNFFEVSLKESYDSNFKKATNFINKAVKGHLNEIQDIGAINALINQMSSSLGADQFDVIEIFLISATATVSGSGVFAQPKRMEFKDEKIKIKYTKDRGSVEKEILILKRLIDLNWLYNSAISKGNSDPVVVNFVELGHELEAIKAADENNFESYLCIIPAILLAEMYKKWSTRLFEKNVRSFLDFKKGSVNSGMKTTIIKEPEKFIAYNNGLTITASNKEVSEINGKVQVISLTDFQIVNGGQTASSIYFSQKEKIDISKVKVMAKINVAKNISEEELDELIINISNYSNSQTRVSPVDRKSNNPILVKIKALTESIITPSGKKWFFEKSKGEFRTKLKIAGLSNKNRIEKDYPKEFRFTKEQLGKYYSAWNNEPYKVKKGGEAIFRSFIEDLTIKTKEKSLIINRDFYEILISKIIFFKALEDVYGLGNSSIGQLRAAVVPYTISVIYSVTEGDKKNPNTFNLSLLWSKEGLEDDLKIYFKELMTIMNGLVKKYSKSDDASEYSKKKELWDDIYNSTEIHEFLKSNNSLKIFNKYSISKKELEKKLKAIKNEVDFQLLTDTIEIVTRNSVYYKSIRSKLWNNFSENELKKIDRIINNIQNFTDFEKELIDFDKSLSSKVSIEFPEVLDEISNSEIDIYKNTLSFIVNKYNKIIDSQSNNLEDEFSKIGNFASAKNIKYSHVFFEIGKLLKNGNAPSLKQLYYASFYVENLRSSK